MTEEGPLQLVEHELVHHRQKHNWDCGISCVLMALPDQYREQLLEKFTDICKEEGFQKSTWTIDLCYLLRRFDISHIFYTTTLGVDPSYQNETYYSGILRKDEERVQKRFADAASNGIVVRKYSLVIKDFVNHLKKHGSIILLTNSQLLTCERCRNKPVSLSCLDGKTAYRGHYIILCGYNLSSRTFLYHNPGFKDRVCEISFQSLDTARLCYGTDEDVIFIFSENWTED